MELRQTRLLLPFLCALAGLGVGQHSQTPRLSTNPQAPSNPRNNTPAKERAPDAGIVANGVYHNKILGFSFKIPDGWVLRTDEMNAREEGSDSAAADQKSSPQGTQRDTENAGRVLLAAFSRPPEAKGQEVNSSVVIAAESVSTYPGLKDAAQYFGPLTEVATEQGFGIDEDPYEIAVGPKTLVRGDFHKDVGSRVMRQSTLVFLSHGYAVSITVIGGSEDEVEELVDALTFATK